MIQFAQYFAMALVVSVAATQAVPGDPIKVAVVQTVVEDAVPANLQKFLRFIEDAKTAGCRLVVFPENSPCWPERSRPTPSKAELDAAIKSVSSAAKGHEVYVAFGTAYRNSEAAKFRNRAIVFGPSGQPVMAYGKSSEVPPAFDVDGVPCNLLICSDRWYLEMSDLPCLVDRTKLIIDISGGHGGDDGRIKTRYGQITTRRDDRFHAGASFRTMWFDLKGIPAIVTIGDDVNWIEIGDLAACRGRFSTLIILD